MVHRVNYPCQYSHVLVSAYCLFVAVHGTDLWGVQVGQPWANHKGVNLYQHDTTAGTKIPLIPGNTDKSVYSNWKGKFIILHIHGYGKSPESSTIRAIDNVYIENQNWQVKLVVVDWSTLAETLEAAESNAPKVAAVIGAFLAFLQTKIGISGDKIHLRGHDVGVDVAGLSTVYLKEINTLSSNAGAWVPVLQITGLDPNPIVKSFKAPRLFKPEPETTDVSSTDKTNGAPVGILDEGDYLKKSHAKKVLIFHTRAPSSNGPLRSCHIAYFVELGKTTPETMDIMHRMAPLCAAASMTVQIPETQIDSPPGSEYFVLKIVVANGKIEGNGRIEDGVYRLSQNYVNTYVPDFPQELLV